MRPASQKQNPVNIKPKNPGTFENEARVEIHLRCPPFQSGKVEPWKPHTIALITLETLEMVSIFHILDAPLPVWKSGVSDKRGASAGG